LFFWQGTVFWDLFFSFGLMGCKFYDFCKKKECCEILGECVFGHEMIANYPTVEPKIMLHCAKNVSAISYGIFDKIKKGQPLNTEIQNQKREALGKPTKQPTFPNKEPPIFVATNLLPCMS